MDLPIPPGGIYGEGVEEARSDRLAVLLAGVPDAFDDAALADRLRRKLRSRGALPPPVQVRRLRAIPRSVLGKAPLIKRST